MPNKTIIAIVAIAAIAVVALLVDAPIELLWSCLGSIGILGGISIYRNSKPLK